MTKTKTVVTSVVKRNTSIAARLASPMGGRSMPIASRQKDEHGRSWFEFYVENGAIHDDQVRNTHQQLGWDFATVEDLEGPPGDYGFELRQGRLVRGLRGQEVLMRMHREDRAAIAKAKTELNLRQALGPMAVKQAIVEKASADLGDESASFLNDQLSKVTITDTMERIPLDEQ